MEIGISQRVVEYRVAQKVTWLRGGPLLSSIHQPKTLHFKGMQILKDKGKVFVSRR